MSLISTSRARDRDNGVVVEKGLGGMRGGEEGGDVGDNGVDGAVSVIDGAGVFGDGELDGDADDGGDGFGGGAEKTAAVVGDGDELDLVGVEDSLEGGGDDGVNVWLGGLEIVGDKHLVNGKRHVSDDEREEKKMR